MLLSIVYNNVSVTFPSAPTLNSTEILENFNSDRFDLPNMELKVINDKDNNDCINNSNIFLNDTFTSREVDFENFKTEVNNEILPSVYKYLKRLILYLFLVLM